MKKSGISKVKMKFQGRNFLSELLGKASPKLFNLLLRSVREHKIFNSNFSGIFMPYKRIDETLLAIQSVRIGYDKVRVPVGIRLIYVLDDEGMLVKDKTNVYITLYLQPFLGLYPTLQDVLPEISQTVTRNSSNFVVSHLKKKGVIPTSSQPGPDILERIRQAKTLDDLFPGES